MTDADQSSEKDLVGIKGWLLFYVIGPGILGTLWGVTDAIIWGISGHPAYRLIFSVLITANVLGLYLIFVVRKPITRTYHIWLNFIWAGYTLIYFIASGLAAFLIVLVPALLIWPIYWVRSKRVRATYCQDTVISSD